MSHALFVEAMRKVGCGDVELHAVLSKLEI